MSRVNPDALCKEEVLTGLNCPVDFVLSTADTGIGYLSSRTDGILQVNLTSKTSTQIVTTSNITSPAGLFLIENLTTTENDEWCGGNTLTDATLFIADEGTELDGGMIWRWCLITDDTSVLSGGSNPSPVSEVGPGQIKHPRGVMVLNRTTGYATGHNPDISDSTQSALLARWTINNTEVNVPTFLTAAGEISSSVKDLALDADGKILIGDPGQNGVLRYDIDADTLTLLTPFAGGPRDILPIGNNSDGVQEYLVSQFDDGALSRTTFVVGTTPTTATTGITLDGPDGLAQ